jgi:uncharacterized protein YkwD
MRRFATTAALAAATAAILIGFAGQASAATATTGTKTTTAAETKVLQLVNQQRAARKCPALKANAALTKAARGHSLDMAKRNFFAHNTPQGVTPWTRMAKAGYTNATMAENIAAGQPTAAEVVRAWMNSPAHRANILDCSLRSVGTGLATGGQYGYYWTQDFGSK